MSAIQYNDLLTARKFKNAAQEATEDSRLIRERLLSKRDDWLPNAAAPVSNDARWLVASQPVLEANFHWRQSFGAFFGEPLHPVNLVDCFEVYALCGYLWERYTVELLKQFKTPEELATGDANYMRGTDEIQHLSFALWNLYMLGREDLLEQALPLFDLYQHRDDGAGLYRGNINHEGYEVCIYTTVLLARKDASAAKVAYMYETVPICEGIGDFWENDEGFKAFTVRAADWHYTHSRKRANYFDGFALTPQDYILPSWIFALDKFRSTHLKRPSCLGDHDLLRLGAYIYDCARAQNHPKLPLLMKLQRYIDKHYNGNAAFDCLTPWKQFLGQER